MYPNKIINAIHPIFKTKGLYPAHLGVEWLEGYTANKNKRLELKHEAKKNPRIKMIVDMIKLSLNGGRRVIAAFKFLNIGES